MYKKRRQDLIAKCKDECSIVIFSGNALMHSADEAYPFSVDRNFYYLTGLDQQDMILHIHAHAGKVTSSLFILPFDELQARWVGGRMLKEEAKRISGVDQVYDINDFKDQMASLYNASRSLKDFVIYVDGWHYQYEQRESSAQLFVKEMKEKYPLLKFEDIFAPLTKMRMVKDETEIQEIVRANKITSDGVVSMMKNMKDGILEMEAEGWFDLELKKNGCKRTAFSTIAASGKNATVLHYSSNNTVCHDGELFLCDLGATSNYYCADVSRTFPVNGKFTERQKQIYNTVLEAQKLVEKNAKPGLTTRDLNQLVVQFYASKLEELGLTKGVREYYFHGVSHHLGLDTHDVTLMDQPLEPGMVITNEPGLYIADEGIGIRIEDDLLITEEGCTNLTCTPKEIDEIESIMKK